MCLVEHIGEGGETWDRGDLGHQRLCLTCLTKIVCTIIITAFEHNFTSSWLPVSVPSVLVEWEKEVCFHKLGWVFVSLDFVYFCHFILLLFVRWISQEQGSTFMLLLNLFTQSRHKRCNHNALVFKVHAIGESWDSTFGETWDI